MGGVGGGQGGMKGETVRGWIVSPKEELTS